MKLGDTMDGDHNSKDPNLNNDPPQYAFDDSDDDDDSTTRSNSPTYISFRDRPDWSDVEPISIKTQTAVMNIKYTERYEDTFSYFRAMLMRDELSERALALTAECIELQKSNFSVWYFRRRILRKLTHHLANELSYVEKIIEDELKNYQVWHHRKTIVEWLRDASHDKQFTASVLAIDNKNYHAWQHRQWFVKEFNLWEGELEFTDAQLAMDVRNNSAWNHRFFVVKETKPYEDNEWLNDELLQVHRRITQSPNNESSWSYLRGLLLIAYNSLNAHDKTKRFCDNLYTEKNCRSPHLLAFILDMIHEELSKTTSSAITEANKNVLKSRAKQLCETLSETDQVRSRYWNYIGLQIKEL